MKMIINACIMNGNDNISVYMILFIFHDLTTFYENFMTSRKKIVTHKI